MAQLKAYISEKMMNKPAVKLSHATILGSGTSMGVPTIGCECGVCTSNDPKNQRYRTSIMVTTADGTNIVFDTAPEFRLQMLREGVRRVENIIYTHTHADHCHGFDDLRGLYFGQQSPVTCHLKKVDLEELRDRFSYAFEERGYLGEKPQIHLQEIGLDQFNINGLEIDPVLLPHGGYETLGFRIGRFAYATDFKFFPSECIDRWKGKVDVMIASGLRHRAHSTHSTIGETIELFAKLGVRHGVITHLSHEVDYTSHSKELPPNVVFAYDGLRVDLSHC